MSIRYLNLALTVVLAGVGVTPAAYAADVNYVASAVLTSDYVFRGLSQSSEGPAVQLGFGARTQHGYYVNAWGTTLDTEDLAPDFGGKGVEVNVVVGLARPFNNDWLWEVSLSRYETFSTDQILDYDVTELVIAVNYRERLRLAAAYAPRATDHARNDAKLSGPRRVLEAATSWPLSGGFAVDAGLGYSDLDKVSDVRHFFWNAGASYQSGRYRASLTLIGTDSDARDRFIDGRADTRVTLTLIATLSGS